MASNVEGLRLGELGVFASPFYVENGFQRGRVTTVLHRQPPISFFSSKMASNVEGLRQMESRLSIQIHARVENGFQRGRVTTKSYVLRTESTSKMASNVEGLRQTELLGNLVSSFVENGFRSGRVTIHGEIEQPAVWIVENGFRRRCMYDSCKNGGVLCPCQQLCGIRPGDSE